MSEFHWFGKSKDGSSVQLQRLQRDFVLDSEKDESWRNQNHSHIRKLAVLDVETTGLDRQQDSIIELAIRCAHFDTRTGEVIELLESWEGLQSPGVPLSEEVSRLTGLTDKDLDGKSIDWAEVDHLLDGVQLIVAHNAAFDRPFMERYSVAARNKPWGCSMSQVDWNKLGYPTRKLDVLSIYHGYFVDAHRAFNDANATLFLLTRRQPETDFPYLLELLENARKPVVHMKAKGSPFESKDALKQRGYGWNAKKKFWHRMLFQDELKQEISWLEEAVYCGAFRGEVKEIPRDQNFRSLD